jgi:hypothetical protein
MAVEILCNVPQLLLIFYGLTCVATRHGKMLLTVSGHRSLYLVPATGAAASLAGWGYAGFGLIGW